MTMNKRPGIPFWCLLMCLVAGLTLLTATTCPHVSWFGQILCGTMGAFLVLATVAGLLGPRNAVSLARTTESVVHAILYGEKRLSSRRQAPLHDHAEQGTETAHHDDRRT